MAVYDGKVFFSWGDVSRNFRCHSIRKSFLSALHGIHVAGGELRLDATGAWVDPGDAGLQLALMIIRARAGAGP